MELSERLDVLLGMKERANGAYCRAYDCDTAISIVNAQTESEAAAPYATVDISSDGRHIKTPVRHGQGD